MHVYVDEQLGNFVSRLEHEGHDVVFAGGEGRAGRTDAWHFREAMILDKVLITYNRGDFQYLHRLWTSVKVLGVVANSHAGVLTCATEKDYTPADWLPAVIGRLKTEVPKGYLLRWIPMIRLWRADEVRVDED